MKKMDDGRIIFYDYAKPFFSVGIEKKHDTYMFFSFSIFNVTF